MSPPARPRRGFTTVEIAVVLVIIGLMAALVLPKVRVDNAAVDSAARALHLSMLAAQRDAVARAHNVLVVVDGSDHTLSVVWDANGNGVADAGERSRPVMLPNGVRFAAPPGVTPLPGDDAANMGATPTIVLQRNGAADRVHTIYITSTRSLGGALPVEARAVRITRATGRPAWFAWTGADWRRGS
jgi:prepilin-type N-terminal cleavage/methylation domain-containing protein